jgi:hypothetical protein
MTCAYLAQPIPERPGGRPPAAESLSSRHQLRGVEATVGLAQRDPLPLDLRVMRAGAAQVLAADTQPLSDEELTILTLQLRGHLVLLIPEVEDLADFLPAGDPPRECATAGIAEARRRLSEQPDTRGPSALSHAQRLARSVDGLCTHLERLAESE